MKRKRHYGDTDEWISPDQSIGDVTQLDTTARRKVKRRRIGFAPDKDRLQDWQKEKAGG